jgi:hypothetical protein
MPKVLTETQVRAFERNGCLSPIRAMSAERARHLVMFDNSLIHGSGTNAGPDRRFLLLVEMLPTWAKPPRVRQPAMLMRGVDTHGTFDEEPRPDAEWSETSLANWVGRGDLARQAHLRGQPHRPERGLRRHAPGDVTRRRTTMACSRCRQENPPGSNFCLVSVRAEGRRRENT